LCFAPQGRSVPFFDISTSKGGANVVRFSQLDFNMRFAPQRQKLLQHLNFQERSENGLLFTF
jgi:hypothetical protein